MREPSGPKMCRLLPLLLFLLSPAFAGAQEAPPLYLLSDGKAVHIILGSTPPGTAGFEAYRRGPGEEDYRPMTLEAIRPVSDPYRAYDLLGKDAPWLARRFDTADPVRLWRKLEVNRPMAEAYALISPGLRMALGRTLIDRSVRRGERYRYRIILLDRRGVEIERYDRRVTVEAPAPPPPAGQLRASAGDRQVALEWDYRRYRGGAADTTVAFHIFRRVEGEAPVRVNRAPVLRVEGHLSFLDRTAVEGVRYRYGVAAVDMLGYLSETVYSAPLRLTDTRPPLVPMGLTAADREEGVLLVWNISPDVDAAGYHLYRSDSLEGEYRRLNDEAIPLEQTRYMDGEVRRGRAWFYALSAVDRAGNESPRCGSVTVIPADTEAPPAVTGLRQEVDPEERSVLLRWDPSPAEDLRGYLLYRKTGEGSYTRISAGPIEAQKAPRYRDIGFRSRGLRPGGSYGYAVTALDHSGNESEKSELRLQIPDLVPPRRVFSFSARTTRAGAVELRWQPALDRDLSLHRIYRRRAGSAQNADGASSAGGRGEAMLIGELPAERRMLLDEEVERGTPYLYHIVEVDEAGNASEASEAKRVVPVDGVPPAPPQELRGQRRGADLLLSWQPPPDGDVTAYRVYRADYPGAQLREITREPLRESRYRRRGAGDDIGAVYRVTAVDSSGNEGQGAVLHLEEDE